MGHGSFRAWQGRRLDFGQSLSESETVVASSERCDVAVSTGF